MLRDTTNARKKKEKIESDVCRMAVQSGRQKYAINSTCDELSGQWYAGLGYLTAFVASIFAHVGNSGDCFVLPQCVTFAFNPMPCSDISFKISITVSIPGL